MRDAIILCGGLGTRLRSVFDGPKCMAPVDGKPFLAYLVGYLRKERVRRIILAVGYKKEAIMECFGDSVEYSVEVEPLGTGGAAREAMKLSRERHVLVFNGDTFCDLNLTAFFWHRFFWHDLSGHDEVVMAAHYAPGLMLVNAGAYVLARTLKMPDGFFSLEEYLWGRNGHINLFAHKGFFVDIGTPEGYERAKKELKNHVDR